MTRTARTEGVPLGLLYTAIILLAIVGACMAYIYAVQLLLEATFG